MSWDWFGVIHTGSVPCWCNFAQYVDLITVIAMRNHYLSRGDCRSTISHIMDLASFMGSGMSIFWNSIYGFPNLC